MFPSHVFFPSLFSERLVSIRWAVLPFHVLFCVELLVTSYFDIHCAFMLLALRGILFGVCSFFPPASIRVIRSIFLSSWAFFLLGLLLWM
jgi:hypothetical protein